MNPYMGDVTANTAVGLVPLEGVDCLFGDLYLYELPVSDLSALSSLTYVEGDVTLEDNEAA